MAHVDVCHVRTYCNDSAEVVLDRIDTNTRCETVFHIGITKGCGLLWADGIEIFANVSLAEYDW